MTEWKIVEQNNNYEVSSCGNVRNRRTGNILSGDINSAGYRRVILYYGARDRFFIHRLVAKHFCEGAEEGLVVNHMDGVKLNNSADNLEWVTRSENDKHAFRIGLKKAHNKIPVAQIDPVNGEVLKVFKSITAAKEECPEVGSNIQAVCRGELRTAGGFVWEFA